MTEHGRDHILSRHRRTPVCLCGEVGQHSDRFDAYFCPVSRDWLESTCCDPECGYCDRRPSTNPNTSSGIFDDVLKLSM